MEDTKKSVTLSFGVTFIALLLAVVVGFNPEFSWLVLIAILLTLTASCLFRKRYTDGALVLCRILVGLLFVFSSFVKGVDPLGTQYKMYDYFIAYGIEGMGDMALPLAVFMILAEFLVGACLIVNVLPRLAVLGASLLMLFFTITTFFDAMFDLVLDCGCFGTAIKMSNWQTFFKNLIIDSVLIPLIFNNKSLKNKEFGFVKQIVAAVVLAALFLGFEIYNIRHLPVIDFMEWKVGNDMSPKENTASADIYLTYKNKITGETKEYLSPNYPWNDSVWMSEWEFVSQRVDGDQNTFGFSILDAYGDDYTHVLFDSDNLLVLVAPYINEFDAKDYVNCERIVDLARANGLDYIWITSENSKFIDSLYRHYDVLDEVYYGDELELKTMVRSCPGLMLMKNGVVVDKWSKIDFPSEKRVLKLVSE